MTDSVNFKVVQGDTFRLGVTCQNEDGSPIDITDQQVMFQARNEFGGRVICATATLGDGIYMIDSSRGKFELRVSTSKFTLPKVAYQIKLADFDEDIEIDGDTLATGYILVEKGTISNG